MFDREGKDGKALRKVFFHPVGQFGRGLEVAGNDILKTLLSAGAIGAIKDGANGLSDCGALIKAGHVGLGILLEVKLAALPGDGWENGLACRRQSFVIVADNQ